MEFGLALSKNFSAAFIGGRIYVANWPLYERVLQIRMRRRQRHAQEAFCGIAALRR